MLPVISINKHNSGLIAVQLQQHQHIPHLNPKFENTLYTQASTCCPVAY